MESELGLHLLYCERIQKARMLPFSKARERIRRLLLERQRRDCQRAWLAELRGDRGPTGDTDLPHLPRGSREAC